jgi:hypothetical protein
VGSEAVWLGGGPAQNRGLVEAVEDENLTEVRVAPQPQFTEPTWRLSPGVRTGRCRSAGSGGRTKVKFKRLSEIWSDDRCLNHLRVDFGCLV